MTCAYNTPRLITSHVSAVDLTADTNIGKALKLDTNGDVVLCGAGERAIGFLNNLPNVGEIVEIAAIGGGAIGKSAATLAVNVELASDAVGDLVAAVATDYVIAISLHASVDNDQFSINPVLYLI